MRAAPKWRSFVPTSREIRFALTRKIEKAAPALSHRLNLFHEQGDWDHLSAQIISSKTEYGDTVLTCSDISTINAHFDRDISLNQSASCTEIYSQYDLGLFHDAYVMGHSGQAVDRNTGLSISPVNKNSARPALLRDTFLEEPAINLIFHRAHRQQYYHFMLERVPQYIWGISAAVQAYDTPHLLFHKTNKKNELEFRNYVKSNFPNCHILEAQGNERFFCKTLLQPRFFYSRRERAPTSRGQLQEIVKIFFQGYGIERLPQGKKRLFISRCDARVRNIINEEVFYHRLRKLGFDKIIPGQMDHSAQVKLFSEAEIVVGAHGAGLSNIIFMPPGGKVFELFGRGYVKATYLWLARLAHQDYFYHICGESLSHQHFEITDESMETILARLEKILL